MSVNAARHIETPVATAAGKAAAVQPHLKVLTAARAQTVMHPHIYRIALGCWLVFLAVFWMTFWISANALFMVVIGTFYATVFFGVPYIMLRQVPGRTKAQEPLLRFLEQPFATNTGVIRGHEALLQVILVPVCLILGGTAMGFIIHWARALAQ